jgi:hypothetical protein
MVAGSVALWRMVDAAAGPEAATLKNELSISPNPNPIYVTSTN